MRPMNLDRIETQPLGVAGTLCKGAHHVIDVLLGHNVAANLTGNIHPRWGIAINISFRHCAALAHAAAVPQLGRYFAAFGVHRINNLLPSGKSLLTVAVRHIVIPIRRDVIRTGTHGNDQAHATRRTATVVLHRGIGRNVFRGVIARHRRHHHTIVDIHGFEGKGVEQAVDCGHGLPRYRLKSIREAGHKATPPTPLQTTADYRKTFAGALPPLSIGPRK